MFERPVILVEKKRADESLIPLNLPERILKETGADLIAIFVVKGIHSSSCVHGDDKTFNYGTTKALISNLDASKAEVLRQITDGLMKQGIVDLEL